MIEVHLYGKLRTYCEGYAKKGAAVMAVPLSQGETLSVFIDRIGIPLGEINHIFHNSKLLVTRTNNAILYDFPLASHSLDDWELSVELKTGDRLGLFGLDIPMLSM